MIASLAVPLNAAPERPLVARLDNADGWLLCMLGPLNFLGLFVVGPLNYNDGWSVCGRSTGL